MIFRSLALRDFGTYGGEQRLDLGPEDGRPITLIGGTNGAGKTTILEAMLLCLHGRRALGPAVSQRDYEWHLNSRIHHPVGANGSAPNSAAVRLELDHSEGGATTRFVVERSWHRTMAGAIKEQLSLTTEGDALDDLPQSAWQDFLDGLVPPGVAGLFLFDGERIQELAEDETGEQLREAVHRLMGLDVLGQLQSDLSRYAMQAEARTTDDRAREYEEAEREFDAAQARYEELFGKGEELSDKRVKLVEKVERQRQRFAQQGGVLAAERERLQERQRKLTAKTAAAQEKLRALIADLLPLALAPAIGADVVATLERERALEEDEIIRRRVAERSRRLARALSAKGSTSAAKAVEAILVDEDRTPGGRLHDVTPSERGVMVQQLKAVLEVIPGEARTAGRALKKAEEEQARLEGMLATIPSDSAVAPLLEKLQKAEREVGGIDEQLVQVNSELNDAKHKLDVAERNKRNARAEYKASDHVDKRTALALRTIDVVEEFSNALRSRKLETVELETARYFNRLSRKGELLSQVKIDSETFDVTLTRWDGTELPKVRLSAGEKQLFAISVLWALAKVAQRPLPVVVDTPLARLDIEHRQRLLREYFPHVSHQVIVLSTDTEVDLAAASELDPVIARSYRLEHDTTRALTVVEDGYFLSAPEAADAR